jgi:phosphatidylglycerol---prolipoprotein diacylglyceryl transferase
MYPRLLHIYGPLWIQSYGVMIAIGFIVFLLLTIQHPLRRRLIGKEEYLNILFWGLASGIFGGRLLFVITNPTVFSDNWLQIFYPWAGGFAVFGAIVGILIIIPFYLRWRGVPILPLCDLAALYAPLLQAIGRIGCFLAGCCYGAPAPGMWWAITFTNPQCDAPLNIPLHPTQLYMSLASLCIFLILKRYAKQLLTIPGSVLFLFLILENVSRFTIDFWRGDRNPIITSLWHNTITISQFQYFSLFGFLFAVVGFMVIRVQSQK